MGTFSGSTKWQLDGSFTGSGALANPTIDLAVQNSQTWGNGTGDNQVNQVFQKSASANATPTTYDLAGGITDDFGTTLTFTKVREIYIRNKSTTTAETLILAGNFVTTAILSGTAPTLTITPGGVLVLRSGVDGYTVTATTADVLSLDPGSNNVSFDLIILGNV